MLSSQSLASVSSFPTFSKLVMPGLCFLRGYSQLSGKASRASHQVSFQMSPDHCSAPSPPWGACFCCSPGSPHFLPSLLGGFSIHQKPELQGSQLWSISLPSAVMRSLSFGSFKIFNPGFTSPTLGLICLLSPLARVGQSSAHSFPTPFYKVLCLTSGCV